MATNIYDSIKSPVCRRMMKFFEQSLDAEKDNRDRALTAKRFRRGGKDQWSKDVWDMRTGLGSPTESYNQIPQFVHQVTNDMRMNMPQTRFIPETDADKEKAEVLEDIVRGIQSGPEADVAYDTAADNQVTIGWGYWRYITEYANDDTFDQVIKLEWIPNPLTVYDDPTCLKQNRLDRKKLIQTVDLPRSEVNGSEDVDGKKIDYSGTELTSSGDNIAKWITDETVRVAEYWEVTETTEKRYRTKDGKTTKEKPSGKIDDKDVRDVTVQKVMWYKTTAMHVLEEREWPGTLIPYVFVAGEMENIDGNTVLSGLVEQMMSPQRQYNIWTNAATETVAMMPKAPYMLDPRQIEGFEGFWDYINKKNYPFAPYHAERDGVQFAPPQRANNNADVSGMIALIQNAQTNFYTTTGIYPASLGKESNEKSGKAIMARQREGDTSTFHFPDNMARGLCAGGIILDDLIPVIYDGSRIVRGVKEDKSTREIKINQEFEDDRTKEKKNFDLTEGNYHIVVTTGPSFTTRRQEASDAMIQLAQSTNLMEVAPDIVYSNQDWPGAEKIAERYKRTLPPQLTEGEEGQKEIPPQVQMQMQQMGAVIQQLQGELQQAQAIIQQGQQELESKQADNQLKMADLQLKQQDIQSSAENEQAKVQNDAMRLQIEASKLQLQEQENALKAQELELKNKDLELKTLQAQMNFVSSQNQPVEAEDDNGEADAQRDMMLAQSMAAIQESMNNFAVSLNTPKNVVITRDPVTGLMTGAVAEPIA